jgi:hypothetical protein
MSTLLKLAVIRPGGELAYLNCPCGQRLYVIREGNIECKCGAVYDSDGWRLPLISEADQEKIDTLAAHFIEHSELLMGLSNCLTACVKHYVKRDAAKREEVRP